MFRAWAFGISVWRAFSRKEGQHVAFQGLGFRGFGFVFYLPDFRVSGIRALFVCGRQLRVHMQKRALFV